MLLRAVCSAANGAAAAAADSASADTEVSSALAVDCKGIAGQWALILKITAGPSAVATDAVANPFLLT